MKKVSNLDEKRSGAKDDAKVSRQEEAWPARSTGREGYEKEGKEVEEMIRRSSQRSLTGCLGNLSFYMEGARQQWRVSSRDSLWPYRQQAEGK